MNRPNIDADEEKWLQQIAYQHGGIGGLASHELEFGAMVAAAEREKVAKWMIERSYATGHGDTLEGLLAELDWQIAENWTNEIGRAHV